MSNNLFQFSPLRIKLFIIFLLVFFLVLFGWSYLISILQIFDHFIKSNLGYIPIISGPIAVVSHLIYIFHTYLLYVPSFLFGETIFQGSLSFNEIIATPSNFLGWTVTTLFYVVVAFLLSLIGNLKQPKEAPTLPNS